MPISLTHQRVHAGGRQQLPLLQRQHEPQPVPAAATSCMGTMWQHTRARTHIKTSGWLCNLLAHPWVVLPTQHTTSPKLEDVCVWGGGAQHAQNTGMDVGDTTTHHARQYAHEALPVVVPGVERRLDGNLRRQLQDTKNKTHRQTVGHMAAVLACRQDAGLFRSLALCVRPCVCVAGMMRLHHIRTRRPR